MSKNDEFFHKNEYLAYTKERGFIMKNIIRKSIATIVVIALTLTLAMPVTAEAATKKAPKLNKSKVTLTITKKKTKPTVQLKVKNTAGKKVKWTSSNKKVATVSAKGKVTAKKKGSAVITIKVKGSKTLRCKVTVKDKRKPVTKKPVACQHKWVAKSVEETVTINGCQCACGEIFEGSEDWNKHHLAAAANREYGHGSFSVTEITKTVTKTKYICSKCGAEKE